MEVDEVSVTVRIPTPLRTMTGGASQAVVNASTVRQMIAALDKAHPGLAARLCEDSGEIRRFVNVFVGDEDVRFLQGLDTPLTDGVNVSIIPAVAGGAE